MHATRDPEASFPFLLPCASGIGNLARKFGTRRIDLKSYWLARFAFAYFLLKETLDAPLHDRPFFGNCLGRPAGEYDYR